MTPSTKVTHAKKAAPDGKAIETWLRSLQNNHRLAAHVVERKNIYFSLCKKILNDLKAIPASRIDQSLLNHKPSLFSMSLLPAENVGAGIALFSHGYGRANDYGYFFDLSQTQKHPPKVVCASNRSLRCGTDRKFKLKQARKVFGPIDLELLYSRLTLLAHDPDDQYRAILDAMGGGQGNQLTEKQLDILGSAIQKPPSEDVIKYNEILVAAGTRHIAAIMVPYFPDPLDTLEYTRSYQLGVKLQAALVGLDHLKHKMNFPITLYHVTGPERGKIAFLGQTREQLIRMALESLCALGPEGIMQLGGKDADFYQLIYAVQDTLNIRIDPINDEDSKWMEEAKKQLAKIEANPEPSRLYRRTSFGSGVQY